MPNIPPSPHTELLLAVREFVSAVDSIWADYLSLGPGKLDREKFPMLTEIVDRIQHLVSVTEQDNAGRLSDGLDGLFDAVQVVHKLAERCVCRNEGLCFITGEAGLIPRPDLYDQFRNSLDDVRRVLASLQATQIDM